MKKLLKKDGWLSSLCVLALCLAIDWALRVAIVLFVQGLE